MLTHSVIYRSTSCCGRREANGIKSFLQTIPPETCPMIPSPGSWGFFLFGRRRFASIAHCLSASACPIKQDSYPFTGKETLLCSQKLSVQQHQYREGGNRLKILHQADRKICLWPVDFISHEDTQGFMGNFWEDMRVSEFHNISGELSV